MKLSVVIPCYNAGNTLAEQLSALAAQEWPGPWEVIIVDNGSTDRSREIAAGFKEALPLIIVEASARKGAAHARNVGAEHASGEALLFCDADDEVERGWLSAMGSALSEHEFVAGRLSVHKLNPLWVVKSRGTAQDKGLREVTYPPYLKHAAAANLGVRRAIHEAVGGFDESMLCLQDTDYCFRIQLQGVALHFVGEAVVNYRFRVTMGSIYRQSREYSRFRQYLYRKYRETGPRPTGLWRQYWKDWGKVVRKVILIRDKGQFGKWIKLLGKQVGRTRGCIEFRIPPV